MNYPKKFFKNDYVILFPNFYAQVTGVFPEDSYNVRIAGQNKVRLVFLDEILGQASREEFLAEDASQLNLKPNIATSKRNRPRELDI